MTPGEKGVATLCCPITDRRAHSLLSQHLLHSVSSCSMKTTPNPPTSGLTTLSAFSDRGQPFGSPGVKPEGFTHSVLRRGIRGLAGSRTQSPASLSELARPALADGRHTVHCLSCQQLFNHQRREGARPSPARPPTRPRSARCCPALTCGTTRLTWRRVAHNQQEVFILVH